MALDVHVFHDFIDLRMLKHRPRNGVSFVRAKNTLKRYQGVCLEANARIWATGIYVPRSLDSGMVKTATAQRELCIENLLVRIHLIVEMNFVDRPCTMGV